MAARIRENITGVSVLKGLEPCCDIEDFIKAMAGETRQQILVILRVCETNVSELIQHLDVTQPTISYHLAILNRAGLVTSRRVGKYVYYQANQACVAECCGEILDRYKIIVRDGKDRKNA